MANVGDSDIVVNEFEFHSRHYIPFQGKKWMPLSSSAIV